MTTTLKPGFNVYWLNPETNQEVRASVKTVYKTKVKLILSDFSTVTANIDDVELATLRKEKPQPDFNPPDFFPFYQDYLRVKQEYPDSLILYQNNGMLEAYGADADRLAEELELVKASKIISESGARVTVSGFSVESKKYLIELWACQVKFQVFTDGGKVISISEDTDDEDVIGTTPPSSKDINDFKIGTRVRMEGRGTGTVSYSNKEDSVHVRWDNHEWEYEWVVIGFGLEVVKVVPLAGLPSQQDGGEMHSADEPAAQTDCTRTYQKGVRVRCDTKLGTITYSDDDLVTVLWDGERPSSTNFVYQPFDTFPLVDSLETVLQTESSAEGSRLADCGISNPASSTATDKIEYLDIAEIRIDGGTQQRVKFDLNHVKNLEAQLEEGHELEPIVVFFDGLEYWLADGFHRIKAIENHTIEQYNGQAMIACYVKAGDRRDAILYSVGANADHKPCLPRTNADKRRAVECLLNDPEWSQWSDREIARNCKVSDRFVNSIRKSICEYSQSRKTDKIKVSRNGKEYEMTRPKQEQREQEIAEPLAAEDEIKPIFHDPPEPQFKIGDQVRQKNLPCGAFEAVGEIEEIKKGRFNWEYKVRWPYPHGSGLIWHHAGLLHLSQKETEDVSQKTISIDLKEIYLGFVSNLDEMPDDWLEESFKTIAYKLLSRKNLMDKKYHLAAAQLFNLIRDGKAEVTPRHSVLKAVKDTIAQVENPRYFIERFLRGEEPKTLQGILNRYPFSERGEDLAKEIRMAFEFYKGEFNAGTTDTRKSA